MPCQGQRHLLPRFWSRKSQIHSCAVAQGRQDWERESRLFLPELFHLSVYSVVSFFASCEGLKNTFFLWHSWPPSQFWVYWQLPLVSFRCCFHKATSEHSRKSGSRTNSHIWTLFVTYGGSSDPGLAQSHVYMPERPQLLGPDTSQSQEHPLSIQMFCRQWICKATVRV